MTTAGDHTSGRGFLQSDEMFRLLVASVRDYAIFMLDPSGRVATWNAGAQRFKGYEAGEIIGRHFSTFYPEVDVRAGKCEYELEVATREGRFEDEGWRIRKDGTRFWANVVITAVRDEGGALLGFAKVTRDLTERKRAEADHAARLAAEEASRAKDEFLAMLSHELRNPLAPVVTALQLIKLRGDQRGEREYAVIERHVTQLQHLVDDLLDVARLSRSKLQLERRPIELRKVLAQAVEMISPALERKAQQLSVDLPRGDLVVEGDASRLVQVFVNLFDNAVKYGRRDGHVWLTVTREDRRIAVEVRDDGQGIAPALLPRVFELFVQGAQDKSRAVGGLGLGLSLVHSLVELHGGTVEVHSEGLDCGSRFIVTLPASGLAAPRRETDQRAAVVPGQGGRRVLLVEDNEDARALLASLLREVGHDVRDASDAEEALDVIADFDPDAAVLDLGLPGIDGFALASELRRRLGARVQLIALSGYGQDSDRVRSREAGFDLHLLKPADTRRLLDYLAVDRA